MLKSSPTSGITTVELIITIFIIAILSTVGLTSILAIRQTNSVTNSATQIQSILDTAKNNSQAVKPDNNGQPSLWGVLFRKTDNHYSAYLVPIDTTLKKLPDSTIASSEKILLPPQINVSLSSGLPDPHQTIIAFEKLTAIPTVKKLNPGGVVNDVSYSWSDSLLVTVSASSWQQSVSISSSGASSLNTITKQP